MRIRKIALAIAAVLCVGNNVVQATIPTSQRNALLQIYNALNGPNWGSSWDGTKDPCNWAGVLCNTALTSVSTISLVGNSQASGYLADVFDQLPDLTSLVVLTISCGGTLPPTLGSLTNLRNIEIGINQISGAIPSAWSGMTNIVSLQLYNMPINGTLPDIFGGMPKLTKIVLTNLSLSNGPFPMSLGLVPNLNTLQISGCSVTGSLPVAANWVSLTTLNLQNNNFAGNLPDGWKLYNQLQTLVVAQNTNLNGSFPASWSNMTALTTLNLFNTAAFGDFPASWIPLPISTLYLGASIWRTVPANLDQFSSLTYLDMSSNPITVLADNFFTKLTKLVTLTIMDTTIGSTNVLVGGNVNGQPLPSSFYGLAQLTTATLSGNLFNGVVGGTFASMTSLQTLNLNNNKFTGLDSSICAAPALKSLSINSMSSLTGTVPSCIGNLTTLQTLDLSKTGLTGPAPASLSALTSLRTLSFNGVTGMNGTINFANMTALTSLSLQNAPVNFDGDYVCSKTWTSCNVQNTSKCGWNNGAACQCTNLPQCTRTWTSTTSTSSSTMASSSSSSSVIASSSAAVTSSSVPVSSTTSSSAVPSSAVATTSTSLQSSSVTTMTSTISSTATITTTTTTIPAPVPAAAATTTPGSGDNLRANASGGSVPVIAGAAAGGAALLVAAAVGYLYIRRKRMTPTTFKLTNFMPSRPNSTLGRTAYTVAQPEDLSSILTGTIYTMLGSNGGQTHMFNTSMSTAVMPSPTQMEF